MSGLLSDDKELDALDLKMGKYDPAAKAREVLRNIAEMERLCDRAASLMDEASDNITKGIKTNIRSLKVNMMLDFVYLACFVTIYVIEQKMTWIVATAMFTVIAAMRAFCLYREKRLLNTMEDFNEKS